MIRETRYRWEPEEPLPEGWRQGPSWLRDDSDDMSVLYTSAPSGSPAYDFEHKFVRVRRITQERFVTPWVDVDVPPANPSDLRRCDFDADSVPQNVPPA